MNHRELVLSARKKAKFAFLSLPEALQDEIIDGLDGQALTLEAARDLVKSRGHSLSHEAIAGYYRAVRTERRIYDANQEMARIVGEFADKPYAESLKSLTNLIIATAASGLADGSVGIKDINLSTLIKALPQAPAPATSAPVQAQPGEQKQSNDSGGGLSDEAAEEIPQEGAWHKMTRIPDLLLPYQKAWIADKAPVKLCEKSRRVGLSWCEAADDVLLASRAAGMDVWYIGYNQDMAREFVNDCAHWVRAYRKAADPMEEVLVKDEDQDIIAFRITFASGKRITALSSRPSNLRGKQGKVVIDEAAFHNDLAGLIKAAIALLMWGGRVVIISTHNGEDNPFNDLIGEVRAGKKPYSIHRITLDEALAQGLYRRICLTTAKEWTAEGETAWRQELIDSYGEFADEELFCVPSKGSGIYLPRNLIEACMDESIPVLRWSCKTEFAQFPDLVRRAAAEAWCREYLDSLLEALPPNQPTFFGEDFGRVGDLTVIAPMQEQPKLAYRDICQIELRNVPFDQQRQILFYLVDRLPRFCGGALDARGNGMYLAEVAMQRYGATRIAQVMLTQPWYIEQMPKFKAAFEDRKISIPRDADTLDDLRAIKMEKGVAKVPDTYKGKGRDGGQRHGDAAIAHALGWFATQTPGAPIEFQSTGMPRITGYMENF